jgi:uncharacterized protein YjbJ (UPF0337 family)
MKCDGMLLATPVLAAANAAANMFSPTFEEESAMNWDRIEGNWKQFKGKVKQQWGKLTDDELDQLEGSRDQLVGKIQEQYGITKDEAEKQVENWSSQQADVDAARRDPGAVRRDI